MINSIKLSPGVFALEISPGASPGELRACLRETCCFDRLRVLEERGTMWIYAMRGDWSASERIAGAPEVLLVCPEGHMLLSTSREFIEFVSGRPAGVSWHLERIARLYTGYKRIEMITGRRSHERSCYA